MLTPDAWGYAKLLDASAAVKLVVDEPGSGNLKRYFEGRTFFITDLCLAEALGVMKRKLLRDELTRDQYSGRCSILLSYIRNKRICIDDISITRLEVFMQSAQLASKHDLDLSDALQLVSVKHGRFRSNSQESKTLLITADGALESAAIAEGLRVWNCQQATFPPDG